MPSEPSPATPSDIQEVAGSSGLPVKIQPSRLVAKVPGYIVDGPEGPYPDPAGKVVDGWLDTGDLARVDADGFVYLAGRQKDLIIRGGHNIDPAVIEDALRQQRHAVPDRLINPPSAMSQTPRRPA